MNAKQSSPGLHLHPTAQPRKYDFTLKPNYHMIVKHFPWTSPASDDSSPASDDSTMQIRLHLKIKGPYDYKTPPLHFTCIHRLNHANTTSL